MNKELAFQIIEVCKNWKVCQKGFTKEEEDILNAKRKALKAAWDYLGDLANDSRSGTTTLPLDKISSSR